MRKQLLSLLVAFIAFTAAISNVSAQVTEYRLNENFDGITTGLPSGWDNSVGTASATYRWQSDSRGYNASRCVRFDSYDCSSGYNNVLFTPSLDLSHGEWILTFRYKNPTGGEFSVYLSTDNGATYLNNAVVTNLSNTDEWVQFSYSITGMAAHSSTVKVGFMATSNYGNGDANIYLDDVTVESAPTCKSPVDFAAQGVTQTQATIFWGLTPDGAVPAAYVLNVTDAAGQAVITDSLITPAGTSFTITGLTAGTTYNVTLRGDCQASFQGYSSVSNFTFATLCQPQNAPFETNFDAATAAPECSYALNVELNSTYKFGSTGQSMALKTTVGDIAYIIFPELNLAANNAELSFFVRPESVAGGAQQIMVALVNDPFDLSDIDILFQDALVTTQWREVRANTRNCYDQSRTTARLMIMAGSGLVQSTFIDNVSIHTIPTCIRPEDFAIRNVTATTADFSWTTTNAAQARITAITGSDTTYFTATSNPYTVTGLTPNTDYEFQIRGICSATDSSELNPYSLEAHTQCLIAGSPIFQEGFEQTTTPNAAPECWTMGWINKPANNSVVAPFSTTSQVKNNGNRSMALMRQANGTRSYLTSQLLPVDEAGKYLAKIWVRRDNAPSFAAEGLKLWVNTVADDTVGGTCLGYIHRDYNAAPREPQTGWYEYEYLIPTAGNLYLMVEGVSEYGGITYFDDISVSQAPECVKPRNVSVENVTTNSADIVWQAGNAETEWQVAYTVTNAAGDIEKADTINVTGTTGYTITGLHSSVSYTIAGTVSAVCQPGVTSEAKAFSYNVDMVCAPITDMPFNESFEGTIFPPLCWQQCNLTTGSNVWSRYNDASKAAAGNYTAKIPDASAGSMPTLVTPPVSFQAGTAYEVRFAMYRGTSYADRTAEGVYVYVSPNATDTTGAVRLGFVAQHYSNHPQEAEAGIYYYTFKVPATVSGDNYLLFTYLNQYGSGSYIDDITVRPEPACADLGFTVSDITSTGFRVSLTDSVAADWVLSYGPAGISAESGTQISCSGRLDTVITGLASQTEYDVYVRRICGSEFGFWSPARTIKTSCASAVLPYTDDFENYGTDIALNNASCFSVVTSDTKYIKTMAQEQGVTGNSIFNNTPEGSKGLTFVYDPQNTYSSTSNGQYDIVHTAHLQADHNYEISVYSKAYEYFYSPGEYDFDLSFIYGADLSSMNVISTSRVSNNSFQRFMTYFTVAQDGDYQVGFRTDAVNGNYYYLYADDYSLREVACIPPTGSLISQLSSTAAMINFISSANQWEMAVSAQPIDITGTVTGEAYHNANITTNAVSVTGLAVNTEYYYTIRSICNGQPSDWMTPKTFRTRCSAITPPYSTDFATIAPTRCWSSMSSNAIGYSSTEGHTGAGAMELDAVTAVSPEIDADSLTGFMLDCWVKTDRDSINMDYGVITDPDDPTTYENLGSVFIRQANTWTPVTVYFDALLDEAYEDFRTARHVVISAGQRHIFLDDLSIEEVPTCPKPVNAVITDLMPRQVTLDWAESGSATQWIVRATAEGMQDIISAVTAHPYTITGLQPTTTYNIYVASVCSATDTSAWQNFGSVTTGCDFITDDYKETFETMVLNYVPTCWDNSESTNPRLASNPDYIWGVFQTGGTNNCLRLYNYMLQQRGNAVINTPEFVLEAGKNYLLEFDLCHQASCGDVTLKSKLRSDADFSYLQSYSHNSNSTSSTVPSSWTHNVVNISAMAGNTVQFQFYVEPDYGSGSIFIDNVSVMELLNCSDISNLAITQVGEHTVTATFADTCAAHTAWQYTVVERGVAAATGTAQTATDKTISVAGLATNTAYDLYVRSDCGDGDYGHWIKVQFSTTDAPATVPYICDFTDQADNAHWQFSSLAGTNSFVIGQDPQAVINAPNALYVSANGIDYGYTVTEGNLVMATRTVEFGAGEYKIEIDWQCTGGYSNSNFARMYLVPAYAATAPTVSSNITSATYSGFTWPGSAIAIDGGTMINLKNGHQHTLTDIDMTEAPGVYRLVFLWKNHTSASATQYPLAVDNIAIRTAACADPKFTISGITQTTAQMQLTNPDADVIRYIVSTSRVTADSILSGTTTGGSVSLTGLAAGRIYYAMARRECQDGNTSAWTVEEFATECAVATLPITENFEDARFPSICWDEVSIAPGTDYFGTQDGHWARLIDSYNEMRCGAYNCALSQGPGASAMLVTPAFAVTADREYHVAFARYASSSATYIDNTYTVYLSSTPDIEDARLLGELSAYNPTANGATYADIDFMAQTGNYYIIFVGKVDQNNSITMRIDDILIDEYPECRELTSAPVVEATTATTATVSATMLRNHTAVEFGVAPYAKTVTPAQITATVTSTTGRAGFTGLTPATSYAFFARAICTADTTGWTLASRGVTKADDCFAPERLRTVGDPSNVSATFTWNDIPNAATCRYQVTNAGAVVAQGTTGNDTAVVTGLTANTAYVFSVYGLCGSDSTAVSTLNFNTAGTPATLPYNTGFEDQADNALWQSIAATGSNRFVAGTDNSGVMSGSRGLYVSTNGTSYSQTMGTSDFFSTSITTSYISRTIYFPEVGNYELSFDWKCDPVVKSAYGENNFNAYGSSYLARTTTRFTADEDDYVYVAPDGAVSLIGKMTNQGDWTNYSNFIAIDQPGYRNLVFQWTSINMYGFASESEISSTPLAVDNLHIARVTCLPVNSISLVSVRDTAATLRVSKADAVDIDYALLTVNSADSITTWQSLSSTAQRDTITLGGLTANTTYYLFVRQACDAQDRSSWKRYQFTTTGVLATAPYICGFEQTAENNAWLFAQDGQPNYFVIGTGSSNSGQRGLYITNDGTTLGYDNIATSTAFAYRTIFLEPGVYSYSYEWSGQGDTYGNDYGRAFLAPATALLSPAAAQLVPRNSIVLDGGNKLDDEPAWRLESGSFEIDEANSYNLAFLWVNNYNSGTIPFSVDNIEITRMACIMPTLAIDRSLITGEQVEADVARIPENAAIAYGVSTTGSMDDALLLDTLAYAGPTAHITVSGLSSSTSYYLVVRALCSDNDESAVVAERFTSTCGVVNSFPFFESFEAMPAERFNPNSTPSATNVIDNYCWMTAASNDYNYTLVDNTARISGNNCLVLYGYDGIPSDWTLAALPQMDSLSQLTLTFTHITGGTNSAIEVGYLTDASRATTFTLVESVSSISVATTSTVNLINVPASAKRLALRYTGAYYSYIDDIRVNRSVNAPAFNDTICFDADYTGHGFNVANNEIAVGDNVFTRFVQASVAGEGDTTFTANVYRRPQAESVIYDTICEGSAYNNGLWNIPANQVASKRYFNTFPGAAATGCDSVQTLYLTVMPSVNAIIDTICAGTSYQFGDQSLTATGLYTRQYQSVYGCQITESLSLYVLPDTVRQAETICQYHTPYQWNGRSLTASGVYHTTVTGARGCTQTAELALTVITSDSVITAHFCAGGSAFVVDTLITTPGSYTLTRVSLQGCDITYHITAIEDPVITGTATDYVCEGRLYYGNGINGLAVTADTVVTVATRTSDSQCDSVTNLSIRFVPTVYTSFDVTIDQGETYTWLDQTYNETGSYTETLQSSEGCDSVVTLNLVVKDGVDNATDNGRMRIVPNPAHAGAQALVFTEQTGRIVRVEIINSFGATVDSREPQSTPIDITAPQAPGVYHVRITTADGRVYVEKLIVK